MTANLDRAPSHTAVLSANILFLLSAFPYLSPVNFGIDTQPYALIFSILIAYLALADRSVLDIPGTLVWLLLIFFYASCLFAFSPDKLNAGKSLAGYATLFFVTYASYRSVKNVQIKWFNLSVYLWLFFGVAQVVIGRHFGSFLLPRMTTSDTRGVTSLAVEPSYYAIICVFLLVLNDAFQAIGKQEKKQHLRIMLLLILQMLITFSGIGFLFLMIYLMGNTLAIVVREGLVKRAPRLLLLGLLALIAFASFTMIPALEYSRAGRILEGMSGNTTGLLFFDGSIASRVTAAILPIYSFFYSHGLGLGLGTWSSNYQAISHYAGGAVETISQVGYTQSTDAARIMSGWGTAVFELGIAGVLLIAIFIGSIIRGANQTGKISSVFISSGFTIFVLMFMAVPLTYPLFSYVLGLYLYYGHPLNGKRLSHHSPLAARRRGSARFRPQPGGIFARGSVHDPARRKIRR